MGRSGQLVRPRSFDARGVAGGVAGGEELVARLVVRLVFSVFFDISGRLGHKKSPKIARDAPKREKCEKYKKVIKKYENTFCQGVPKLTKS